MSELAISTSTHCRRMTLTIFIFDLLFDDIFSDGNLRGLWTNNTLSRTIFSISTNTTASSLAECHAIPPNNIFDHTLLWKARLLPHDLGRFLRNLIRRFTFEIFDPNLLVSEDFTADVPFLVLVLRCLFEVLVTVIYHVSVDNDRVTYFWRNRFLNDLLGARRINFKVFSARVLIN